ncbi:MAG TPA: universal stress protein [Ktedonobacteraceae bacterium]|nr:universal stress protein [Ktedonobacteraceae bacterium]
MFERILVPLDGSERAERALPVAARLANASRGSILLLRVATGSIDIAWSTLESPILKKEALEAERAQAIDYLAQIAASPELAGISVQTNVQSGVPAACILSAACDQQADLIILGSHGETGLKRWLLGSVAQHVTRHSPTPVLVLHERGGVPTHLSAEDRQPVSILVALDGSPLAEAALTPAAYLSAALSTPAQGALHLALVLPFPDPAEHGQQGIGPTAREQAKMRAGAYLDMITQRLSKGELATLQLHVTSSIALQRDIADALIGMAETGAFLEGEEPFHGCYMMALATHGRSGVERWVMGSVTERILGATILPLLIVRPQKNG